jgi:hypothetical protein
LGMVSENTVFVGFRVYLRVALMFGGNDRRPAPGRRPPRFLEVRG